MGDAGAAESLTLDENTAAMITCAKYIRILS
jgi:hypothetical protein